jgi:hypothetical protein
MTFQGQNSRLFSGVFHPVGIPKVENGAKHKSFIMLGHTSCTSHGHGESFFFDIRSWWAWKNRKQ